MITYTVNIPQETSYRAASSAATSLYLQWREENFGIGKEEGFMMPDVECDTQRWVFRFSDEEENLLGLR